MVGHICWYRVTSGYLATAPTRFPHHSSHSWYSRYLTAAPGIASQVLGEVSREVAVGVRDRYLGGQVRGDRGEGEESEIELEQGKKHGHQKYYKYDKTMESGIGKGMEWEMLGRKQDQE